MDAAAAQPRDFTATCGGCGVRAIEDMAVMTPSGTGYCFDCWGRVKAQLPSK
jgi:hypothetical protein